MRRWVAGAALATPLLLLPAGEPPPVTFERDVAPIVRRSCSPCHRAGGAAPFSLVTYDDVRRRGRQVVEVTRRRYMPPWLPGDGAVAFEGDRRLAAEEIERIAAWFGQGAIEGEPSDVAAAPVARDGWLLGPPDRVVELVEPYLLEAEGSDVYRNFVLPSPVGEERWVRAFDLRPENPRLVHHARILVDRTPGSRRADRSDALPGFAGMIPVSAETPDGILLGWTPGKLPRASRQGLAWRLDPSTDLVVQLHLVPSGKPESVRFALGLYCADRPPELHALALVLGSRDIDIAPGITDYTVEDRYTLPEDVRLVGIYPHAHYLAREMTVTASLPAGRSLVLLHVPRWDFNWQDEFHLADSLALPAGTVLDMRYVYDNSAANESNPHAPPQRVHFGPRTTDEMAELVLQVVSSDASKLEALQTHHRRDRAEKAIRFRERLLQVAADDFESHAALGSNYLFLGRAEPAIAHLRAAVDLRPADAEVRNNLGYALTRAGQPRAALEQCREAVRLDPTLLEAQLNLAAAYAALGRYAEALPAARAALRLAGDDPRAAGIRSLIEQYEQRLRSERRP